ncbi:hypothetical protein M0R45_005942 [Rubus argutus]|uniref:C-JID domain-containing protein n=1 Tax=Rubus argutus TaxID=59490 RepID=A0AAW1YP23_RUBAR
MASSSAIQPPEKHDVFISFRGKDTPANLSGFHSTSNVVRNDSDLVEQVIKDILTKLRRGSSSDFTGLVGVETRIQQILLLYTYENIRHVLENSTGTATVKSICLNTWKIKQIKLADPQVFTRMYNLIFLKFYSGMGFYKLFPYDPPFNISLEDGEMEHFLDLESFPDSLRYLHWEDYPFKSLPSQSPKNLVELHMPKSKLERLWTDGQSPENLKRINLRDSKNLVEIPDLSKREKYSNLPNSIYKMKFLKQLNLADCFRFDCFPEILEPMEHLEELCLSGTAIKQLPESIENLVGLKFLGLRSLIESIPPLGQLSELTSLDISNCKRLQSLPKVPCLLETLTANGCTTLKTVSFSMTAIKRGSDQIDGSFELGEGKHIFVNCLDLDENARRDIMNAAQARIMRGATAAVLSKRKDTSTQLFDTWDDVSACVVCPGNEIPKWFSHQTEGSLININLPPHSADETFLGFAVSAINVDDCDEVLNCRYNFKFNNGQCRGYVFCLETVWCSQDHVFVWYLPFIFNDTVWCTEASFEFCIGFDDIYGNRVEGNQMKRWGVCLLYAQGQDAVAVKTKRPRAECEASGSEIVSDPGASEIQRPKKKTHTPNYL